LYLHFEAPPRCPSSRFVRYQLVMFKPVRVFKWNWPLIHSS
jgi:hypothetical protein